MSTNAETLGQTFAAGGQAIIQQSGARFELLDTPVGPVDVFLKDRNGAEVGRLTSALAGYFIGQSFDTVVITSASAQTVRFIIAGGDAGSRRVTGTIAVTSASAPTHTTNTNSGKTVTNVDGQLLAANASRKYLSIQNNDTAGAIYIVHGAAATIASGHRIGPGGFYEPSSCTGQEIRAIGDVASNANIRVTEGV